MSDSTFNIKWHDGTVRTVAVGDWLIVASARDGYRFIGRVWNSGHIYSASENNLGAITSFIGQSRLGLDTDPPAVKPGLPTDPGSVIKVGWYTLLLAESGVWVDIESGICYEVGQLDELYDEFDHELHHVAPPYGLINSLTSFDSRFDYRSKYPVR